MVRILLDECLHVKLKDRFEELNIDIQASTVVGKGWNGIKNGKLLSLAQKEFDIFITSDQNLPYQQNISGYSIGVIVLKAKSNRLVDLLKFVEPAAEIIPAAIGGKLYEISI